jgi:hypothetical protein
MTLKFVGHDDDEAVVLTDDKTYGVRRGETSNMQVTRPSAPFPIFLANDSDTTPPITHHSRQQRYTNLPCDVPVFQLLFGCSTQDLLDSCGLEDSSDKENSRFDAVTNVQTHFEVYGARKDYALVSWEYLFL